MLSLVDGSGPLADVRRILAQLPAGEIGEHEVFLPVSIEGQTALVFPDGRAYWLEPDGSAGACSLVTPRLTATTRFQDGEEVGIPAGYAN